MRLLPLRVLLSVAVSVAVSLGLVLGLGSCGGPDPEQAAGDLETMKSAVDAELRDMAAAIREGGLAVERATGSVESEGMSTYRAEDYTASAVVVGAGAESEQVDQVASALERAGWTRATQDLGAADPYAQLEREDFRTTIGWTKVGDRELVLRLDQAGEVEVPKDAEPVERGRSEDIDLG